MGLLFSKESVDSKLTENKTESISSQLDYISAYYIWTSNFESLKDLYNKEYCDDLIILTSDIIQKNLTYREIEYMQARVINGEVNNAMQKEPMVFFSKTSLKDDYNNNITTERNKTRMCIGIAKFYIKVAHIFAAIITSVNPIYTYVENGVEKSVVGDAKNKIPTGASVKINNGNLCQRRLSALMDGNEYIHSGKLKVGTNLCSFKPESNLIEEPGIPELEELYYDKYDFEKGKFYGMSEESKKMYENDVKLFYRIFMKSLDVPEDIKKFSDIKIKNYNPVECDGTEPMFKRIYEGSPTESLFHEYSENIKKMIKTTSDNQELLVDIIINNLFVSTIDEFTGDKIVRVDPLLTTSKLDDIIVNARTLLTGLYLSCEADFNNGVEIFKKIADTVKVYKTRNDIVNLEKGVIPYAEIPQSPSTSTISPVSTSPVSTSTVSTSPVSTSTVSTSPVSTPTVSTPTVSTSPVSTSPVSTPSTQDEPKSLTNTISSMLGLSTDEGSKSDATVPEKAGPKTGVLGNSPANESYPDESRDSIPREDKPGFLGMFNSEQPRNDSRNDTRNDSREAKTGFPGMFNSEKPRETNFRSDSGSKDSQREYEKNQRELSEKSRANEEKLKRDFDKKERDMIAENRSNDEKRKREYEKKMEEIKKGNYDKEQEAKKKEALAKENKLREEREKKEFESKLKRAKDEQEIQMRKQKSEAEAQIAKQKREMESQIAKQKEIERRAVKLPTQKSLQIESQIKALNQKHDAEVKAINKKNIADKEREAEKYKEKKKYDEDIAKLQKDLDDEKAKSKLAQANVKAAPVIAPIKANTQGNARVQGNAPVQAPANAPVKANAQGNATVQGNAQGNAPANAQTTIQAAPAITPVLPALPPVSKKKGFSSFFTSKSKPPSGSVILNPPANALAPAQVATQPGLATSFGEINTPQNVIDKRKSIFLALQQTHAFPYEFFENKYRWGRYGDAYTNCFFNNDKLTPFKINSAGNINTSSDLNALKTGMKVIVDNDECIFIEFIYYDKVNFCYYDIRREAIKCIPFEDVEITTTMLQYAEGVFVLYRNNYTSTWFPGIMVNDQIYSLKEKKIIVTNNIKPFFTKIKPGISFEKRIVKRFQIKNDIIECEFYEGDNVPIEKIYVDTVAYLSRGYASCGGDEMIVVKKDNEWTNIVCDKNDDAITYDKLNNCKVSCNNCEGVFVYDDEPYLVLTVSSQTIKPYVKGITFTTSLQYEKNFSGDATGVKSYSEEGLATACLIGRLPIMKEKYVKIQEIETELFQLIDKKELIKKLLTLELSTSDIKKSSVTDDITYANQTYDLIKKIKSIVLSETDDIELANKITTKLDKVDITDIRNEIKVADLSSLNELLKSQTFIDEFVKKLV